MRAAQVRGGLVLTGLLALAACGSNGTTVLEAGSEGGGPTATAMPTRYTDAPVDPDTSVSSPIQGSPAPGMVDTEPSYQVVTPRPGMANKHAVTWEKADVRTPTSVRVKFWGGVEPCYVLDSVKVAYTPKQVVVTLFSGSDPAKPDVACIDIAKAMAVDVKLSEPLGKRKVVDGSPDAEFVPPATDEGGTAAPAGKRAPQTQDEARVVTPRPGMADLQPQSWNSAKATGAKTVRVYFMSGVEPCSVLDSYKVAYEAKRVVITLYSGHDPKAGEVSCVMLAESKAVDVTLTEALDGRELVDGSAA